MQSHYITASRHCITPPHYTTASHHRITSLHYTIALRHCITPLRHNTRSTRSTAYTLGRRYKPISSHNRAIRHSRATLLPLNVPQQFCAAPSGNALPLFRRRNVRINPLLNKPGDSFSTLGRRFKPTSFHNRAARHSRATFQPLNVPHQFCAAPSGNALPLFRRWRVRIDPASNKLGDTFSTLGRRFKPTSFHNRAMRHSRATLQPLNVPQQFCATPLGNITASKCSPTEPRDTLGRRYSPKTFPNSSARHPWATLQAHIVPQQSRATPSGNTSPLFRRRNVRIDPVMNMLGDTFGTAYTLGRHYSLKVFSNRAARHSRATLQPPKRSPTVLRGTLGQHFATFSSLESPH